MTTSQTATRRRPSRDLAAAAGKNTPLGKSHLPLCDLIADKLRKNILSGGFKVGERLVEDRLAQEFAVSRNPVREALRALATEGLVELTPRCGATVARVSTQEVAEMIEVRAVLEGLNARLAARRNEPRVINELRQLLDKGAQHEAASGSEVKKLHTEFHQLLAHAGGNSVLGEMVRSLRDRTALLFAPLTRPEIDVILDEHAAIIRAIIGGDEDLAALLASRHVTRLAGRLAQQEAEAGSSSMQNKRSARTSASAGAPVRA